MAVHFHQLTIKEVYKETPECVIISFDIPEALIDLFKFTHGQNITLKKNIEGEDIRRSYSICTAPFENRLSVAVKKMASGKFSYYANEQLKAGDTLDVLPPTGTFNKPLVVSNKKNYLAIAAGSGITPIISIIKSTLYNEPQSLFTLIYGNQRRGSIIFFEALSGLKNKYVERFNFINILSREKTASPLNFGRINEEKLKKLEKVVDFKTMDETFICGPKEMLFCVKDYLENLGVDKNRIHFELFTPPGFDIETIRELPTIENKERKSKVTIQLDGRSFSFDLAFSSESILDAALKQGADLPLHA